MTAEWNINSEPAKGKDLVETVALKNQSLLPIQSHSADNEGKFYSLYLCRPDRDLSLLNLSDPIFLALSDAMYVSTS